VSTVTVRRDRRAKPRSFGLKRSTTLALNIGSLIAGILIWTLLPMLGIGLPGPWEVLQRGAELAREGILLTDLSASLRRVFIGFVLGTISAVLVGFLIGWYATIRALVEPYIQFFRTIPPLAIIPLAIVFMGIGELPKVFVIFLAAFLVSVVATYQGVVTVDRTMINAARVLGAGDATIFFRVVMPASVPYILVGLRTGLGAAWATLVAAELIAAQDGLGYRMQHAQIYYDIPTIFVNLLVIGILGLLMDRALLLAERRMTSWQERR